MILRKRTLPGACTQFLSFPHKISSLVGTIPPPASTATWEPSTTTRRWMGVSRRKEVRIVDIRKQAIECHDWWTYHWDVVYSFRLVVVLGVAPWCYWQQAGALIESTKLLCVEGRGKRWMNREVYHFRIQALVVFASSVVTLYIILLLSLAIWWWQ